MIFKAGLVFGPVAGHLVFDLKAYLAWKDYREQNPGVDVDATHNYFNLTHWEHLLVGLLAGVLVALVAALIAGLWLKRDEQAD